MNTRLTRAAARAVDWARRQALPLWCERGWDRAGGFVERLYPDGTPDRAAARRVRVQVRQIAVMCQASLAGWSPDAAGLARKGADWLFTRCRPRDGAPGFVHVVDPSGEVLDGRRDAYDQAFALYALSWLYRLDRDAQVRREIDALVGWMEEALWDRQHGGYAEGDYEAPLRRQNPQMHAFEAMLALYDATQDRAYLQRADRLLALLRGRLFDAGGGVLREYFTQDWRAAPGDAGRLVEPGHHFEWIWLLAAYEQRSRTPTADLRDALWRFASRFGFAPTGFVMDACRDDGVPLEMTQRFWPQTEFVKACLARVELGEPAVAEEGAAMAAAGVEAWFLGFLNVIPAGGWIDRLGPDRSIRDASMPASTGYHVFVAIQEAARVSSLSAAGPWP